MRAAIFAVLSALSFACEGGGQFAQGTGTSTIAVGSAQGVLFDQPLLLTVEGTPLGTNIIVTFDATVTASTAALADKAAKSLAVTNSTADNVITIGLTSSASSSKISGNMHAIVPDRMALAAKAPGGALVRGMVGNLDLTTDVGIEVYDAKGSVKLSTSGGVILDSNVLQSTVSDVIAQGDIRVTMPAQVSATFIVQAGGMGKVVIKHPALPASVGQQSYGAQVNGGLAQVKLQSIAGSVTLEARQ